MSCGLLRIPADSGGFRVCPQDICGRCLIHSPLQALAFGVPRAALSLSGDVGRLIGLDGGNQHIGRSASCSKCAEDFWLHHRRGSCQCVNGLFSMKSLMSW